MLHRSLLALVLLVFSAALARAQDLSGQRTISGLTIDYTVSGAVAEVDVSLSLNGQFVNAAVLTYGAPTHDFTVAAGGMSASGALTMSVVQGPTPSALTGDFTVVDAKGKPDKFQGDVVTWAASDDLPLFSQTYNLMANLSVKTTVLNGSRYGAAVDYMSGATLLYSSVLLPPSPVSVTPFDLVIGDVRLNKGAQLTLTPPSNIARGMVALSCTFSSAQIPPTQFSGAVASWSLASGAAALPNMTLAGDLHDAGTIRASLRIQSVPGHRRRAHRMVRVLPAAGRRGPRRPDLGERRAEHLRRFVPVRATQAQLR
jgi:hypothetical protein